jgi:amidase
MSTSEDWKTVALQKRQQIHDAIPREWLLTLIPSPEELPDVTGGDYIDKLLTDKEKEITESDAVQIVAMIGDGSWTAVDVTTAFCHRAAIAGQLVRRWVFRYCTLLGSVIDGWNV